MSKVEGYDSSVVSSPSGSTDREDEEVKDSSARVEMLSSVPQRPGDMYLYGDKTIQVGRNQHLLESPFGYDKAGISLEPRIQEAANRGK